MELNEITKELDPEIISHPNDSNTIVIKATDKPALINIDAQYSPRSTISRASISTKTSNKSNTSKKSSAPDFSKINRFNVSITSLKNKLKTCNNIDELTHLASKIVELEHNIMIEKTTGYKQLEKEKKQVQQRIDKIQRTLRTAEHELQRIGNNLDLKLNRYRATLQTKIDALQTEYKNLTESRR